MNKAEIKYKQTGDSQYKNGNWWSGSFQDIFINILGVLFGLFFSSIYNKMDSQEQKDEKYENDKDKKSQGTGGRGTGGRGTGGDAVPVFVLSSGGQVTTGGSCVIV